MLIKNNIVRVTLSNLLFDPNFDKKGDLVFKSLGFEFILSRIYVYEKCCDLIEHTFLAKNSWVIHLQTTNTYIWLYMHTCPGVRYIPCL